MVNDSFIILNFTLDGKLIPHKIKQSYIEKYPDIKEYLCNRYTDIPSSLFTYKEVIWRILYDIKNRPCCPVCNEPLLFIGKLSWDSYGRTKQGFCRYCSDKCANRDPSKLLKSKLTLLRNYGVDSPMKSDDIRKKVAQTCLEKYGVKSPMQSNIVKDKVKHSMFEKYGKENYSQTDEYKEKTTTTCLNKYGSKNPMQSDDIKGKVKKTCLERYGLTNAGFSTKAIETFKRNKSFNKSKQEDMLYQLIHKIYPSVLRLYRSEQYPFMADFYISELELYIEYHGSMFHNGRLYKGDEYDLIEVEKLKLKDGRYLQVIEQWTNRDINKLNIAKKNHINYLVLYPYWHNEWFKFCKNKDNKKYIENLIKMLRDIINCFNKNTHVIHIVGEKK